MTDLQTVQQFFEGLIDYFFDPCQDDENHEQVIQLICASKMASRLKRQILPENSLDALKSGGWNYSDYADAIKQAVEEWKLKCDTREGALMDGFEDVL